MESPDASAVHGRQGPRIVGPPAGQPADLGDGGAVAVEDGGVATAAVPDQVAQDGRGSLEGGTDRTARPSSGTPRSVGAHGAARAVDPSSRPVDCGCPGTTKTSTSAPTSERHEEQGAEHDEQASPQAQPARTMPTFRACAAHVPDAAA